MLKPSKGFVQVCICVCTFSCWLRDNFWKKTGAGPCVLEDVNVRNKTGPYLSAASQISQTLPGFAVKKTGNYFLCCGNVYVCMFLKTTWSQCVFTLLCMCGLDNEIFANTKSTEVHKHTCTLYLSRLPVLRGHPVILHQQGCALTVSPSDSPVAKVMSPGWLPDAHSQCQHRNGIGGCWQLLWSHTNR